MAVRSVRSHSALKLNLQTQKEKENGMAGSYTLEVRREMKDFVSLGIHVVDKAS